MRRFPSDPSATAPARMRLVFVCAALSALSVMPLAAGEELAGPGTGGFVPVRDRDTFIHLVDGRELRLGRYGVRISVHPDGRIEGRALGWGLEGSWAWREGYFCREMDWSGFRIGYNCQLVEAMGDEALRFTVDRGAGDSAVFRLR
ncbi:MAG: dihydrodipicolinate reductase [Pseudomonadota bacterium]